MKIFAVDRDGWLHINENILDAEAYLEWIDVMDGEYLIIDEAGFLYEPYESEQGFNGYKLRQTLTKRPEVLNVVANYQDWEQLSQEDLRKCRSDQLGRLLGSMGCHNWQPHSDTRNSHPPTIRGWGFGSF